MSEAKNPCPSNPYREADTPEAVQQRQQRYLDFWDKFHSADEATRKQMSQSEYGKRIIRNEDLVG